MNAPSIDIKDMLIAESSLALVFGTNLFIGHEPEGDVCCATIYDTPGYPCDIDMGGSNGYEYPSVEILVRSRVYIEAYTLANNIKDFLHGKHHVVINDSEYQIMNCMSAPFMLNRDENNRVRFAINLDMQRSLI
jgi:hypothetical protein